MADNVGYTEGVGTLVATDDVGGVQYQVIKLDIGSDGASNRVVNSFPVSGTVTANLGTVAGLALDTTLGTTNTGIGAPADAAWTGTGSASVVAAVKGVWNAITFNSLPAGTNAIGTVTAVGNVASAATDSGNPVKVGAVFNTTLPTVTTGQRVDAQATNRGEYLVAISNGGNAAAVKPASTAAVSADPALVVAVSPATAVVATPTPAVGLGSHTTSRYDISAASVTAIVVKASTINIGSMTFSNVSAAVRYVKIYLATSATTGTTTPNWTYALPAGQTLHLSYPQGHRAAGLCYAITVNGSVADTTAGAAADVYSNFSYL